MLSLSGIIMRLLLCALFILFLPFDHPNPNLHQEMQVYSINLSKEWYSRGCVDPEEMKDSVVILPNATAFAVAPDVLVTNHHVKNKSAKNFAVTSFYEYENGLSGFERESTILYTKYNFDISVIKLQKGIPLLWVKPVKIATSPLYADDLVMYIGHPAGGRYITTFGRVKWYTWSINTDGILLWSIDSKGYTRGGNSGSPMFNCRGEVVGVHHSSNIKSINTKEQVASYGTTLKQLRASLQRAGVSF